MHISKGGSSAAWKNLERWRNPSDEIVGGPAGRPPLASAVAALGKPGFDEVRKEMPDGEHTLRGQAYADQRGRAFDIPRDLGHMQRPHCACRSNADPGATSQRRHLPGATPIQQDFLPYYDARITFLQQAGFELPTSLSPHGGCFWDLSHATIKYSQACKESRPPLWMLSRARAAAGTWPPPLWWNKLIIARSWFARRWAVERLAWTLTAGQRPRSLSSTSQSDTRPASGRLT